MKLIHCSLSSLPPSIYPLPLSLPLSLKLKYCIFKALVSELFLQSVSINDVEAFEGYPVFSKSSTLCNFDSVLHLAVLEQQGVYLGQSLCVLLTFKKGIYFSISSGTIAIKSYLSTLGREQKLK